jgi:hypothetical protein
LLQEQNQFIQFGGNNGVETGRGLIQNQNLGIEGEGAGYGSAFSCRLRVPGMQLAKIRQADDSGQFHPDH